MIWLPFDCWVCIQLIGEVDVSVATDCLEAILLASPSVRIAVNASVIFIHNCAFVLSHLVFGAAAGFRC